mmetsp:Transcript_21358/g.65649  ORF Transcript_21358/g.65649 Transcript_21358/m.65649 type:complete len:368 (+) Transcript_21358:324-1427(+)
MRFPFAVAAQLWTPLPFVTNEVTAGLQSDFQQSLLVASDGSVSLSTRRRLRTKCKMDFHKLPYDTQHCSVDFELNQPQSEVVLVAKAGFESNSPSGNSKWKLRALTEQLASDKELKLTFELRRKYKYYETYVIIPAIILILISYSSFFVARTNGARFGLTIIAFLALLNFITGQLNRIPNVAYHVRLLSFLYLSMFFSAAAIFEYVLVNILMKVELKINKAKEDAEKELGLNTLEEKRSAHEKIRRGLQRERSVRDVRKRRAWSLSRSESNSPRGGAPDSAELSDGSTRLPEQDAESDVEAPARAADDLDAKRQEVLLREVREAAGKFGRLFLYGTDMWIKDQYLDIFFRWVYLPLYIIFASFSLNI